MDTKLESDEKKRHAKALVQNEKLKAKYQFEKEVSKELAARNDLLKKEYGAECDRNKSLLVSMDEVSAKFNKLIECAVLDGDGQYTKDTAAAIAKHLKDIGEQLHQINTKFHPEGNGSSIVKVVDPVTGVVNRRKSVHKITDTHKSIDSTATDTDTIWSVADGIIPDGGSEPHLTAVKKSRRRASSVYILEGTGTSLTRHSTHALESTGGTVASVGSGAGTLPDSSQPVKYVLETAPESSLSDSAVARASRKPFQMFPSVEEDEEVHDGANLGGGGVLVTETEGSTAATVESTEESQAVSCQAAPLFEHFLVVGMPQDAADEFAEHIRVFNENTLSSTLRKKFGGLFRTKSDIGSSLLNSTGSGHNNSGSNSASSSNADTETFGGSARSFFSRWGSDSTAAAAVAATPEASISDKIVNAFRAGDDTTKTQQVDASVAASAPASASAAAADSSFTSKPPHRKEDAPLTLKDHNVNNGTAASEATILFRYPPDVDPPPQEICDFCLPLGGKLKRIVKKEEDTVIQEILYGHSQSKRSPKCFVFTLEDKTINNNEDCEVNDEIGLNTGKLFGICVIHPRLLKGRSKGTVDGSLAVDRQSESGGGAGSVLMAEQVEFEAEVCYAFVTRYPLFEFFFQVIWDLITTERLHRMEAMAMHMSEASAGPIDDNDNEQPQQLVVHYDRDIYQYLPTMQYTDVLSRLCRLPTPRYATSISFQACAAMGNNSTNQWFREVPPIDIPESIINASNWALPTLLSWIPVELLVWVISLLMCEAKIIVVGTEPGLVSCGVMGLLSLLRPLSWVAPIIPVLPLKHLDFVESPVPIIAGLVLDPTDTSMTSVSILDSCSDDDLMSVVFDVTNRGVLVSPKNLHQLRDFVLPGAEMLLDKLRECVEKGFGTVTSAATVVTSIAPNSPIRSGISINNQPSALKLLVGQQRTRPLYDVSAAQKRVAVDVQEYVLGHLTNVIAKTKEYNASIEQLKWNRVNGVTVDVAEEDSLLFAEHSSPSACIPNKINYRSDNIGVSAGWGGAKTPPPSSDIADAGADANAEAADSTESTATERDSSASFPSHTSTLTATSPAVRRLSQLQAPPASSFHNFASEENSQLPFVNLLTQPLIGSDMSFFQKFSQSQIYAEYTTYSASSALGEQQN